MTDKKEGPGVQPKPEKPSGNGSEQSLVADCSVSGKLVNLSNGFGHRYTLSIENSTGVPETVINLPKSHTAKPLIPKKAGIGWFDLERLLKFDRSNDSNCMIGNHWLCKGGSLILQGLSGVGKSSLVLQMALSWSVGRDFFGIKPVRALKTILLQAENDDGDFAEPFQDICQALGLTEKEHAILLENFKACREATVRGAGPLALHLKSLIENYKPDIVFLDPLLSYYGDNISDQQAASVFFRQHLQPIQNETGVIVAFNHHLGKPRQDGNPRSGPSHYAGLGSSDIINWARETITMSEEPAGSGIYKLEFGKRHQRTGLIDKEGKPLKQIYLRHSASGVVWERNVDIESPKEAKALDERRKVKGLKEFIVSRGTVKMDWLKESARMFGFAQNTIAARARKLVSESCQSEQPIYEYKAHVNGSRTTATVFSIHPEPVNRCVQIGCAD